jgi:diguanylate cyclase (GGDEF)-like protein
MADRRYDADPAAATGEELPGARESAVIMMVDDEPTTIEVIEMVLQADGCENFIGITDSTRALDEIASARPDLLLLDLLMPDVGGLEILRAMREDAAFEHVPVIILTSSSDPETKLQALDLGATDFLAKPVDPSELVLRVRNTLAAKAYQDRLANFDGLTGLPNRGLFIERLDLALRQDRRDSQECAVLVLNLDRFKPINDTLGSGAGDALLKAVADRLEKCIESALAWTGASDRILSRSGGDEFLILLSGLTSSETLSQVARQLVSEMAEPFSLDGQDVFVSCSIGLALHPGDGASVEALLANAGTAMSHAKRRGGNDLQFYNESLHARSLERLELGNQLRRARDREELALYYQPKLDVATGRITGAEALMRWHHPELGLVSPIRFIPIAEEIGLIASLGQWALQTACRQSKEWQLAGHEGMRIAVNVSAVQFRQTVLPETIRRVVEESGVDASGLILELTEGAIMESPQETSRMLHEIKDMGAQISVDDFGTGYSSLSYLKRFPLDELKIDRSFVQGVPHNADDAAIVTAIIVMAQSLGLSVVAEGVESPDQLEFLRERGCDGYQGFLCSRPIPAPEWSTLLGTPDDDD